MAKKSKKRVTKELTRKQSSRLAREQKIERIIIWSVAALAVLIVGVLVYGFFMENVVKAKRPVAKVGTEPITASEFQSRVLFRRLQMNMDLQYLYQQQQAIEDPTDPNAQYYLEYLQNQIRELSAQLSPANAPFIAEQALDQLIREEIVRQEAERRGITLSPVEIDQAVAGFFGYDPSPSTPLPEPALPLTPTDVTAPTSTPFPTQAPMTAEEYNRYRSQFLKAIDASEQEFRSWIEASLLEDKLREANLSEIPMEAEQVKIHYMTVNSEEKAGEFVARLEAGEDFEVLAQEIQDSEDDQLRGYGYEWEWLPRDEIEKQIGPTLTDLAFSMDVGRHSQPVQEEEDDTWFTVIKVIGREVRELDESVRERMRDERFNEWLEAQREALVVREDNYLEYAPEIQIEL
ncbi:MAG TPA: hypothetical protein ENN19_04895 [Chloroflexi bacterium]|nr:hypothetical protein [Chloroflexota bacterium]